MKAIIFGITGQDGTFLSKLLKEKSVDVIGVSYSNNKFTQGDVADYDFVESIIKKEKPDYIFHFSANSTTRHDALFENHKAISTGTLNILECVKLHCPNCKVFLSGSALQFKNKGKPIDENTPFEASSPYSMSRIHSIYAGRYYREKFKIQVYVGYFFNHDSELRTERHVNKKITTTVNRIKNGSDEKLELGNIDVKKEFGYCGDVVKAIWILVNQAEIYEAIIGTGKAYSIREFTKYCFEKIGKNYKNYVIIKDNFMPEYDILVSNPKLIFSLGYEPEFDMKELANKMLEG